jgi:hypothetical protein
MRIILSTHQVASHELQDNSSRLIISYVRLIRRHAILGVWLAGRHGRLSLWLATRERIQLIPAATNSGLLKNQLRNADRAFVLVRDPNSSPPICSTRRIHRRHELRQLSLPLYASAIERRPKL